MPDGHIIGMDAWAYNIVGSMVDLVHIVMVFDMLVVAYYECSL